MRLPKDTVIVVWDGSLAAQYNLDRVKSYHPKKIIVYAMDYFQNDPKVHMVIADYGQSRITNKYKNLVRFIRRNNIDAYVLLPYDYDHIEEFRKKTIEMRGMYVDSLAKSYDADTLIELLANSHKFLKKL